MKARKAHRVKKGIFWLETETGKSNKKRIRQNLKVRVLREILKILKFHEKLLKEYYRLNFNPFYLKNWNTERNNQTTPKSSYFPYLASDDYDYRIFYKYIKDTLATP